MHWQCVLLTGRRLQARFRDSLRGKPIVVQLMDIKQVLFSARSFLHPKQIFVAHYPQSDVTGVRFTGSSSHVVVISGPRNVVE